jgi:Protein of unknown function (DUF1207)
MRVMVLHGSARHQRGGRLDPWPVVACWLLCAAATVSATAAGGPEETGLSTASNARRVWIFFPQDDLYPQYIADPLRPQSAVMLVRSPSSGIPDSGDSRFLLRLGGRYSIARLHPVGQPDRGFQIDFEGGFFSQFDMDNSLDNIGWDGLFGLRLSYKGDGPWALSLGSRHDSAHVGDEYAQRTGRMRIEYTREEIVLGASWAPDGFWRTYLEAGWGYNRIESEEPLRLQVGVEHISREGLWRGEIPWYAAIDMTVYKENDVQVRTSAQLGLIFPTDRGTNRYRAALEFVSGRSVLGEFSMHDESYIGLGWYFDF